MAILADGHIPLRMGKRGEILAYRPDHQYGHSPANFWSTEYAQAQTHPMLTYSHTCIKLAILNTLVCHKSIKLTCLLLSLRFSYYLSLNNKILLERALSLTPMDRKSHC